MFECNDVLYGVCGQEEREKLKRAQEEQSILESHLARYRKAYPRFPDTDEEEADDQVSEAGIG
jgi:hypothetical protein